MESSLPHAVCSDYVSSHRLLLEGSSRLLAYRHLAWPKLARLSEGRIVLMYFGGEAHTGRKGLYVQTSDDEGQTFGPARLLWWGAGTNNRVANGAIGVTADDRIVILAMAVGGSGDEQTSEIRGFLSDDGGETWERTNTQTLTTYARSVFGRILAFPDGRLLATGFNTKSTKGFDRTALWASCSHDGGYTWEMPEEVTDRPTTETSLVLFQGRIQGIARPYGPRYFEIDGRKSERIWTAEETPVAANRMAAPFAFTHSGKLWAVLTDRKVEEDLGQMNLWVRDGGWQKVDTLIAIDHSQRRIDFGYPWGVELDDGSLFMVYYAGSGGGEASLYSFILSGF